MMEMMKLNNGVEIPMLGFGTFRLSEPEEGKRSVLEALQAGYRLIDTAQFYGTEALVGEAISEFGIARQDVFLTTKVWFHSYASGVCRESVLESMKNLKTDYLDMVLLHWPFGDTYAAWRDLEALYEEGKIRAIGISNFDPDRMIDFVHFQKVKPALNQVETHLFCQRKEERKWMDKYGISYQAYAPLGQGSANEMFETEAVKKAAAAHGKTPAQIALRFLIQNGISAIPKSVHADRIRENLDVFDFRLTEAEMTELEKLDTRKPMIGNAESPEKVEMAMTW